MLGTFEISTCCGFQAGGFSWACELQGLGSSVAAITVWSLTVEDFRFTITAGVSLDEVFFFFYCF